MKSNLEGMIATIGEQVTSVAVSKMDTTTATLVAVIGSVMEQLSQAYEAAKEKGGLDGAGNLNEESVEALKEDVRTARSSSHHALRLGATRNQADESAALRLQVFAIVTGEYAKTEALVRNQVGGFIHFLDVLMAPEHTADDD